MSDLAAFIDQLRLARLGRRVQQQQIAATIGVSQTVLSMYENHHHRPDTEMLSRWAEALGVEMPEGMTGRIDPVAACGTPSGRVRHRRLGEDICDPCRTAYNDYMRDWKQERGAAR